MLQSQITAFQSFQFMVKEFIYFRVYFFAFIFKLSTISKQSVLFFIQPKKAYLVLEDGKSFEGYSFGKERSMAGEVVFNTGLVGCVLGFLW